ncbi:hypothetical protein B296_00030560 [Ensete ventricosum]|uniref:RRM domain-containing protein n=1 Tax=Ensete ventricosum TaxID=4639 RepID=A0A426YU28_ENSVE|nr:hypothetical protein B296_00030560 [Ensete ventricosum]
MVVEGEVHLGEDMVGRSRVLGAFCEPRGFAFVEFVDPYDASEAQYHMNRQLFGGREITVVLAAESRKRPEDMRKRARIRYCKNLHVSSFEFSDHGIA